MLWIKALHVVAMVTWFAGLFYLPRLFVYHAGADDRVSHERFVIMERRLFIIMTIGAALTVIFGLALIISNPAYLIMNWLRLKLVLVAVLVGYHVYCYRLTAAFREGRTSHSGKWFRGFNEVPSILLLGIVLLAVAKPF
jgi:protoporphyrinogen IX oxidase